MSIPVNLDFEYTDLSEFGLIPKGDGAFSYLIKRHTISELKQIYDEMTKDLGYSAITITLQNRLRLQYNELEIRKIIYIALNDCRVVCILLFPDVDNSGNFHYHGIIKHPLDLRPKLKRYFTKNIGFIKIAYLSDPEQWYNYMRKDKGFKSKEHPIALIEPIYSDSQIELFSLVK